MIQSKRDLKGENEIYELVALRNLRRNLQVSWCRHILQSPRPKYDAFGHERTGLHSCERKHGSTDGYCPHYGGDQEHMHIQHVAPVGGSSGVRGMRPPHRCSITPAICPPTAPLRVFVLGCVVCVRAHMYIQHVAPVGGGSAIRGTRLLDKSFNHSRHISPLCTAECTYVWVYVRARTRVEAVRVAVCTRPHRHSFHMPLAQNEDWVSRARSWWQCGLARVVAVGFNHVPRT